MAIAVVFVELWAIAYAKKRFMNTSLGRSLVRLVLGGLLVFVVAVLVGNL